MRDFSLEEDLRKILQKIAKKDKIMHEAVMKKIEEIVSCEDVNHYKNLRAPMQQFKRVHIKGSFVLIFKYMASEDKIIFFDLGHHDNIYE
ncbi:MAG: addiction module toxin RelE [Nanoarchaeota archaeon]|nr:addiction module toxin RelE [Nanoarchaeota archaeon]